MNTKPNITPEHLARLRAESQRLRPGLESDAPGVREEWKQRVESLTSIVARHSDEIDKYIAAHGPMTREEVLDRALTKLLTEKP